MFQRHAPLVLQPRLDWQRLSWMARMLANCTSAAYAINKSRMVRLAEYSRDCLGELRAETGIEYDQRMQGTLQLFRKAEQMDAAGKDIEVLRADGVPFEVLDRAGCIAAEPGLAGAAERIAGGLRLPGDETGDCFKFTNRLAEMATGEGKTLSAALTADGNTLTVAVVNPTSAAAALPLALTNRRAAGPASGWCPAGSRRCAAGHSGG